jgi:hypothetical protein
MTTVQTSDPSSIQTRPSLLGRLKEGDDADAWQEFYRVYGKLVRDFAIRAGLTELLDKAGFTRIDSKLKQ